MDAASISAALGLGFALGLLHALDPDHVLAVANLGNDRGNRRSSLAFCGRWALGHGAVLLLIGAGVLFAGQAMPVMLSEIAESLVAYVLIALGIWVFWTLGFGVPPLQLHRHGRHGRHLHVSGLPTHRSGQLAVMVGSLHGLAGSASLLALLPLTQLTSPWLGMLYLVLFALGVLLAMLALGRALDGLFRLGRRGKGVWVNRLRAASASLAIGFGFYLLQGYWF
ncbi:MAG: urease accessory protein UreH [Pseudomonadota bacterium]|nr:urease accessory protein UreH [Pseudomonadota bacterium]